MGLYDDVKCFYPLPDGFVPGERDFQTKSLDSCMSLYTITEDGRLVDAWGDDVHHYGTVTFYHANWGEAYRDLRVTDNGEPPLWREYVATFRDGRLTDIVSTSRPMKGRAGTREDIAEARRLDAERGVDERDRPLILKPGEKRK